MIENSQVSIYEKIYDYEWIVLMNQKLQFKNSSLDFSVIFRNQKFKIFKCYSKSSPF